MAALRAGDERTFCDLFARSYPMMKRVARTYVASDAVAEEIVQETWMAIVTGIDRFEGRSALGTWIFSILTNQAKTHSARERRAVPFSSDRPERRRRAGGGSRPLSEGRRGLAGTLGHAAASMAETGAATPGARGARPPQGRLGAAARSSAVDRRATRRRRATAEEVCDLLGLSQENQRVLLHRGRSRLRAVLEEYVDPVNV